MKLPAAALLVIATCFSAQGTSLLFAQTSPKPHRHATKTMTDASYSPDFFIDTHADTTQRMLDEHYDLTDPLNGGYVNFEAAKQGKLGAEFFSIWVEPQFYQNQYAGRTLALIDAVHQAALKHPDKMMMAYSVADIERAHRAHKLAALMGIEGGHSIENSLDLLRLLLQAGRALHDADLVELERLGGLLRRLHRSQGAPHERGADASSARTWCTR